jgi:hypothetical protein
MATDRRKPPAAPVSTKAQGFTIHRATGFGLLWRIVPGGGWRLREYDADGNEEPRRV